MSVGVRKAKRDLFRLNILVMKIAIGQGVFPGRQYLRGGGRLEEEMGRDREAMK